MFNQSFTIKEMCRILLLHFLLLFVSFQMNAQDTDGDGLENIKDSDDDNDGIPDENEAFQKYTNFKPGCAASPRLNFSAAAALVSGTEKKVGAIYRIANVLEGTDALIEIEDLKYVTDINIDINTSNSAALQPQLSVAAVPLNEEAFAQYRITFVKSGTTKTVRIPAFFANISDIDGNESISGDVIYFAGHSSYTLEEPTPLTIVNADVIGNNNWTKVTGTSTEITGVDTTNKTVAVTPQYSGVSPFRLRFGIISRQAKAGVDNKDFRIDFTCPLNYATPSTYVMDFDVDGVNNVFDTDSDNDGIADAVEAASGTIVNSDKDSNPDYMDLDSDNDGIADLVEGQSTAAFKPLSNADEDSDGVDNTFDGKAGFGASNFIAPVNTDNTDTFDYIDIDSDNDTQSDNVEAWDVKKDGVADILLSGKDNDHDGLDDAYDVNPFAVNPGNGQTPDAFPKSAKIERAWREKFIDKPTALPDIVSGAEATLISLDNIFSNDIKSDDGFSLTSPFSIITPPVHGKIGVNNNGTPENIQDDKYSYIPADYYNGVDSFIYMVCDTTQDCDTAKVTIRITPVNNAPIIVNEKIKGNEDNKVTGDVTGAEDFDQDGTSLTVSKTIVLGPKHGNFIIDTSGNFTYIPAANYNGKDMAIVKVCDAGLPLPALCGNDTLFITIDQVNDPPVATNLNGNSDPGVPSPILLKNNVADLDSGSVFTYSIVNDLPAGSKASINAQGVLTYTSSPDKRTRTDKVSYQVCDNGVPALCSKADVFIAIPDRSFRPKNDTLTINEDNTGNISILVNDTAFHKVDTSRLTITVQPKIGTAAVDIRKGIITYTPAYNANGYDSLTYSICQADAGKECKTAEVFFNIVPVNDLYVKSETQVASIGYDLVKGNFIANDSDPENTGITADPTPVQAAQYGSFTYKANGDYEYKVNENAVAATDVVIIKVCDKGLPLPGICLNDTINFTIRQYMFISEGFAPDGNGINKFIIETVVPGNIEVKIYNRWGALVYSNSNYHNEWDGKANVESEGGSPLSEGTYFYEITFGNGVVKRSYITILR